jgi:hypothetical protein
MHLEITRLKSLIPESQTKRWVSLVRNRLVEVQYVRTTNLDNGDPQTLLFSMTRFFKFLPEAQRHAFLGSLSEHVS